MEWSFKPQQRQVTVRARRRRTQLRKERPVEPPPPCPDSARRLCCVSQLVPGETALAFYTATNPTDKPIVGISTYNVVPYEVLLRGLSSARLSMAALCRSAGWVTRRPLTLAACLAPFFRLASTLTKSSASALRSSG